MSTRFEEFKRKYSGEASSANPEALEPLPPLSEKTVTILNQLIDSLLEGDSALPICLIMYYIPNNTISDIWTHGALTGIDRAGLKKFIIQHFQEYPE